MGLFPAKSCRFVQLEFTKNNVRNLFRTSYSNVQYGCATILSH